MVTGEIIILIIIALLLAMIFIKYIWFSASRELDRYMRLETDPEFRAERLHEINEALCQKLGDEAELLYEKAHIYALGREYEKSARSFKAYLKLEAEDPEGWAELADACIGYEAFDDAQAAVEKAIEFEPEYEEYRALQLRVGMHLQDLNYARLACEKWQELDDKRVSINKRPHRWSPLYQIGYKETLPDPAVKVYTAALRLRKGKAAEAKALLAEVEKSEPEYIGGFLEEDILFSELKELYETR